MKRKLALFTFLALAAAFTPSQKAQALVSTFDANNFKPAVDSTNFLTLYDGRLHPRGEWNAGVYFDYAHHPLELAAPIGTRRLGVVDDTIIANLYGSYGLTNWFTAGVRVPVVAFNNFKGLAQAAGNPFTRPDAEHDFSMGDIGVDLKFRLINSEYVNMAVVPFVTAPLGRSTTFMGQGSVSGGGKLAMDVGPSEKFRVGLNAGYLMKDDVTVRGARIDDMVTLGAAINFKPHSKIDLIAEGHIETVARDFFKSEVQTPAEVDGAIRIHATKNLDITAGGGAGLSVGVGSPDFRTFLGVNYTRHQEEEAPPPAKVCTTPGKIVIDQKIQFAFDKSVIKPESYSILDDVASVLKTHPDIARIRVEGHTDSVGSDAYNQKLSDRRAKAVQDYLVNKGIEASRLEAIGYGESQPLADNATAEGRAKNRRTEFKVTEQNTAPNCK